MSTQPQTRRGIHRPNAQRLSISLAPLVAQRSLLFRIQTDLAHKASYAEQIEGAFDGSPSRPRLGDFFSQIISRVPHADLGSLQLSPLESSGLYTATASARLISAALSSASLPARRRRLRTPATSTSIKSSASVYSQDSGDDGGDVDDDGWEDDDQGDSNAAVPSSSTPPGILHPTPGVPVPAIVQPTTASPGPLSHNDAQPKPRRRAAKKRMSKFQSRRHAVAFSPSIQLEDFRFSPSEDDDATTPPSSSSLNSGSETSVVTTPSDSPLAVAALPATTTTKPAVVSVNPMHTVDLDFYLQRKSQIQMGTSTNPGAQSSSTMTMPGKGLVKIVSRLSSLSLNRKSYMPARPFSGRHTRSNSTSSLPPTLPSSSSSSEPRSVEPLPVFSRPRALPTIPATPTLAVTPAAPAPSTPGNSNEDVTQEPSVQSQRPPSPELSTRHLAPPAFKSTKRPLLSPPAPSTFTKGHRRHHSSPVPTMVRREWVQGGVGAESSNLGVSGRATLPPVPRVPSEYRV